MPAPPPPGAGCRCACAATSRKAPPPALGACGGGTAGQAGRGSPTRRRRRGGRRELLGGVAAAMALVKAHRMHGHLAARLDPLGSEPVGDPALDPIRLEPTLTPELQARIPASLLRIHVAGETLAEALPRLHETYCGTIAYEIEHISDHEQRVWLRQAIESWRFRTPLEPRRAARAPRSGSARSRASSATCAARSSGRSSSRSRASTCSIPMLDEALELAADGGRARGRDRHGPPRPAERRSRTRSACRTRRSCASSRASGRSRRSSPTPRAARATSSTTSARDGHRARRPPARSSVTLAANPSHLEAVDPVVEGRTRAEQTDRSSGAGVHDPTVAMPILLHGDAAFAGPGRRRRDAQPLRARRLLDGRHAAPDHEQPGRLHDRSDRGPLDALLVRPREGLRRADHPRERRRSRGGDLGRPARARLPAPRSATTSSIDLVGYRRFGHNEQDEAAVHAAADGRADRAAIRPCASCTRARLVEEGVLTAEEADALVDRASRRRCARRTSGSKASFGQDDPGQAARRARAARRGATPSTRRVAAERLRALNEQLLRVPDGFTVHPKLARQLERRRDGARGGRHRLGPRRGARVRVAARRRDPDPAHRPGHRARDVLAPPPRPPRRRTPASATRRSSTSPRRRPRSRSTTRRSPSTPASASSTATRPPRPRRSCSGRRSSATSPTARRSSSTSSSSAGRSKWRQTSRLTLLLPHGYEGNGPEHSSARLERFLQLARAGEHPRSRTARPRRSTSTCSAARRSTPTARPLVVMTPKGLLRLKDAASTLDDLAEGSFQPVLDDPSAGQGARPPARALLAARSTTTSSATRRARPPTDVAVARLEQLYPFPVEAARELIASYPHARRDRLGAGGAAEHGRLADDPPPARGGGPDRRPGAATSAAPGARAPREGYPTAHLLEQDRIARAALGVPGG